MPSWSVNATVQARTATRERIPDSPYLRHGARQAENSKHLAFPFISFHRGLKTLPSGRELTVREFLHRLQIVEGRDASEAVSMRTATSGSPTLGTTASKSSALTAR